MSEHGNVEQRLGRVSKHRAFSTNLWPNGKVRLGKHHHHRHEKRCGCRTRESRQCSSLFSTLMASFLKVVTGSCYLEVLNPFMARVCRDHTRYRQQDSWSFLHGNTLAHTLIIVRMFLNSKGVVVMNHSPYSPDLSPCDYFLFPNLKLHVKGTTFNPTFKRLWPTVWPHPAKCALYLYIRCTNCAECSRDYFE